MKIVIDIGHGGKDPGAVHYSQDGIMLSEAGVVSDIAVDVMLMLQRVGVETEYVAAGEDSITIGERAKRIASHLNAGADLVLSLHMNKSGDEDATGTEVFYLDGNKDGAVRAKKLVDSYAAATKLRNRGAKPDTQTQVGGLGIMRKPEVTATKKVDRVLLLECGFISNDEDVAVVRTAAHAIAEAALRAAGSDINIPADPNSIFPDVPFNDPGHDQIKRMKEAGILKGYGDGLFRPDQMISRREAAIIADRQVELFKKMIADATA